MHYVSTNAAVFEKYLQGKTISIILSFHFKRFKDTDMRFLYYLLLHIVTTHFIVLSAQTSPLQPAWQTAPTLLTCESVLFHPGKEVLFVSCINGRPLDKDHNGFIALVDLEGNIVESKWVTGLNAPKGMGLSKDGSRLYVTDIDRLAIIDVPNRKILRFVEVPGALFLNDIDVAGDGTVYFTDSDTGKLYAYKSGKLKTVLKYLHGPNGVLCEKDRVLIVSFAGKGIWAFNPETGKTRHWDIAIPAGDGFVPDGKGGYFISNWNGEVYHVRLSPTPQSHLILDTRSKNKNAADICFIPQRKLLLIPTFFHHTVEAYGVR